jgi:hypothetical protein
LTWETQYGEQAEICSIVNLQYNETQCFDVQLKGTQTLTTRADATLYQFDLKVSNATTISFRTQYVCIDVSDWFFENPPDLCAAAPPIHTYVAAQRFENGLMLWLEATDEFIVFTGEPDNTSSFWIIQGPIQLKPEASVDNRIGNVPEGYFEPVSGFGLLWRNEIEGGAAEGIRESLGWALEPEFGFETASQRGIETAWHILDRYIRDPDGKVIYLFHQAYLGARWIYWDE